MRIEWDEHKRRDNARKHGFDFADAELADWEAALVRPSYGGRYLAILPYEGTLLAIAFSPLGTEAISLVSMRPASRQERKDYAEA